MSTSRVYLSDEVSANATIRQGLVEILESSWTEAAKTLDDELKRASHVICFSNEHEEVMAFASWKCENVQTPQGAMSTGYMGIGAVSENAKGKGLGKRVVVDGMIRCFDQANKAHQGLIISAEKAHPLSPMMWGTTASVVSYLGLLNTFDIEPKAKNTLVSKELLSALRALYAHHSLGALNEEQPFVLREKMSIRYTDTEHKRLQEVLNETPCPIMEDVDERRGDRLVMVLSMGSDGPRLMKGPLLSEVVQAS